jgi:hypothetical protein
MAIAMIKYDEHNHPKCTKYCLVVLRNLAVYHKHVLKNCNVKRAFVQSTLPDNEVYFLKPPPGCPCSQPNQCWHLIRSLYRLKRAPRIWFSTLCSHLWS